MKATVNKVPTNRATARGLLHFIVGICKLKLVQKKIVEFKINLHPKSDKNGEPKINDSTRKI